MARLLLLRIAKLEGNLVNEWRMQGETVGGIKDKMFAAAAADIEAWLAGQPDVFFDYAATGRQPFSRDYERIAELYVVALVGAENYSAASEFLSSNTVLTAERKQLTLDAVT
eukprot:jgi/Hompol1/4554/HPOL_000110-RA